VFGRSNDLQSITVVDFGLAKAARARERMEGVTGTLWYTAPEILLGVPYSPLVDMWSLGVVMYVAITGELSVQHFFIACSLTQVGRTVCSLILPDLLASCLKS
jgi:serine/threonine protein kinase